MNVDDNKIQEFFDKFKSFLPHLKFDPPSRIMTGISMVLIVIWAVLRLVFKFEWSDFIAVSIVVLNVVVCIRCVKRRRFDLALSGIISIVLVVGLIFSNRFFGTENYGTVSTVLFIVYLALFAVRGKVGDAENHDE